MFSPCVLLSRYKYLHNEPNYCSSSEVDLLVLVSSSVDHFNQREAIRWTWASEDSLEQFNVRVIFLLGQGNEQQSLVADESRISRDIVQEDFKVINT